MNRQAILNGFPNDDRLMFASLLDSARSCAQTGRPAFSDFFDPARCSRFLRVLGSLRSELRVAASAFGGAENCERRMIGICPDDSCIDESAYPITALEVTYNARYAPDLGHKDFLGSVLGLGIERAHVGDVMVRDGSAVVFVCSDIAGFILANLERVGKTAVKAAPAGAAPLNVEAGRARELTLTLSSMRLDNLISAAHRLPRSKAADLIRAEKVFVNWALVKSVSENVKPGDIVTARGFGRLRVAGVMGLSKKDKIRLKIEIFS